MPSSLQEYDLAIDNIMTFCEEPAISLENLKDLLCDYLMLINVSLDASIFLCSYSTLGRGPKQKNENFITAVCFFTVIIHINALENVCNPQKSDLAVGLCI